jgi:N-acetylglutamate synthase-like GNAT family acetyltransferase
MLLEQILADADNAGVECYLEATDTAKPLYERHGFVTVEELRFDPAAYGVFGYEVERQTIMVRGALNTRGVRSEVRSWPVEAASVQL